VFKVYMILWVCILGEESVIVITRVIVPRGDLKEEGLKYIPLLGVE
jgi:hypothetical protein